MSLFVLLLGFCVGALVGLFGIGGGLVLVPAMVYLLGMEQHLAQGTSLLILLPPLGIGALTVYWKRGHVDLRAGILCALGILVGGYAGSRMAMPMSSSHLKGGFGCLLMLSAVLLWRKTRQQPAGGDEKSARGASLRASALQHPSPLEADSVLRQAAIFAAAGVCGIAAGLFGVGGGALLVPVLGLLFDFEQHRAQGTSLVALVPPTGLLAFLSYLNAGKVSWNVGLLLIPGIFLGGIAGSRLADRLKPRRMRQVFAAAIFVLGAWQAFSIWLL